MGKNGRFGSGGRAEDGMSSAPGNQQINARPDLLTMDKIDVAREYDPNLPSAKHGI
jgi:hypothetical protein